MSATSDARYATIHSEPAEFSGLSASIRIWSALLHAEVGSQFGKTGLGLLAKVAEPCFHMGVLVTWHYAMRVMPIYGTSIVLIVATGMMPIFLFIHLSMQFDQVTRSKRENFRAVTNLDLMFVKGFVMVMLYLVVGVVVFAGIYIFQTRQALPFQPVCCVLSLLSLAIMGTGVAIFNSIISELVPVWHFLWGGVSRSLIIFGGVLYVPDYLPPRLRDIMQWNPVAQAVELFRQGIYPNFPQTIYKPYYLFSCTLSVLLFGLLLERTTRNLLHKWKLMPL